MTEPPGHPIEFLPELALGVLPPAEAEPVRRHLAGCGACAEEFAELERVAALLPLAADAPAPGPAAREALLQRARAERLPRPRARVAPARLLQAAAALLLFAAGGLAGWAAARGGAGGTDAASRSRETLLAAAARGETLRADASSSAGIRASLLLDPASGLAVAVLDGLAPAPAGRTYQAWLIEDETPRSAGLLAGDGSLLLAPGGDLRRFSAFALTLEPAGGVPAPTGDPLVVVPFALAARR
ncbi:anti-sigma factor [Tepidiforma sp.]|uniref:anti-sigma factor n=1 Tax=Tepidiforma sp. TaxID=2682230 RepID=UPI002630CF1D|nr:anti-sigma factor [Tepidiforma sp.]MCX7618421.1 anti-sigma factor [Tepidiforma sp.]